MKNEKLWYKWIDDGRNTQVFMFSNPTENATLTANFKKKCPIYLKNYQNLFKNCRGYDGEIGTKF